MLANDSPTASSPMFSENILPISRQITATGWLAAIFGLVLTIMASISIDQQLERNHIQEFTWTAESRIQSIYQIINHFMESLLVLKDFVKANHGMNSEQFELFTRPMMGNHPYLLSLSWFPMESESLDVSTLHARYQIKSEKYNESDVALAGLVRDEQVVTAFSKAEESKKVVVSGRLARSELLPDNENVVAVVVPLSYNTSLPARSLNGFIVGVVNLQKLTYVAIEHLEPRGVDVTIHDDYRTEDPPLVFYPSRLGSQVRPSQSHEQGLFQQRAIPVADRQWTITCTALNQFRSAEAFREAHWFVLVGGLVFTLLLTVYMIRGQKSLRLRIAMENSMAERETLFRQMTETVHQVFWAVESASGRLLHIGYGCRNLFGHSCPRILAYPEHILKSLSPRDRRRLVVAMGHLRRDRRIFSEIFKATAFNGGTRWILVRGFPVVGSSHRVAGYYEDVTEHKLAEDALKESESKLRSLFNHSPDVIFTVDRQDNFIMVNRPLSKLSFKYSGDRHLEHLLPQAVQSTYIRMLNQVLEKKSVENFQYEGTGNTWWNVRIAPITSENCVVGALVILTDITDNHRLEQQALRNARLASLGVLAAGVAHEINNPNHAILMNATLLEQVWKDVLPILDQFCQEQGDFALAGRSFRADRMVVAGILGDLAQNARRIQKIVANLKHLGKQDLDRMDETVDLCKVLSTVCTMLDSRIRKFTDRFNIQLPRELPAVVGNSQQLEQVFINLLDNAMDALSHRHQEIRVGASWKGDSVYVHVTDEGKGIPKEKLDQIMEPFFTTKTESGGLGLGLPIVNDILKHHRGNLHIDSRQEQGTTVTVRLPCARPMA